MSNLKTEYNTNVIPKLKQEFNYSNVHQIPKITKIHVSCGLGLNAQNPNIFTKSD